MSALGRRRLLAGAGITVAFAMSGRAHAQGQAVESSLPGDLKKYPLLDSWIRLDADGHITVFTGKAELGQGLKTALIQIAADELCVAPAAIDLVTADTLLSPDEGVTAGSHSMQDSGAAILNAAANVRKLLTEAAAWRFVTSADQVILSDGVASGPNDQHLTYGELTHGLSLHVEASPDVPRRTSGRRLIGEDLPRVDIPAKVSGGQAYLQDMRLPGMLHARVVRGPSDGTRLKPADFDAAGKMSGVEKIVREGRFVAVLAQSEWQAIKAMRRLQEAGWERVGEPMASTDITKVVRGLPVEDVPIFDYPGPPAPDGASSIEATYTRPCLMHASIGPSCAVAQWQGDRLTVWTHSQGVGPLRKALAELLHVPADRVRCVHVEGSGCYGHNGADDVAADAALAARAVPNRPVRLQWMREQEHGFEPLGPAMTVQLKAELDGQGRIAGWRHEVWSNGHSTRPSSAGGLLAGLEVEPPFVAPKTKPIPMPEGGGHRNANPLYALLNAKGVFHFVEQRPVRVSALRSLGAHMNIFSIESFMDELAAAAKADPVAFRLAHMTDDRARDCIQMAADKFGWAQRKKGSGFAFARYKNLGAYCALALEVEVDRISGAIGVKRAVAAVDSGEAVSPDGIRNQVEGAIVQSLSWTTREAVTFAPTHRTSFDWSAYPILRFPAVPHAVEVHVIDRPGEPFLGTGEAGQGPAAAALANAVFDATGVRLRDMPLSPQKLKAALES